MGLPVQNADRETTAKNRFIDVFREKTDLLSLFTAFTDETQSVEDMLFQIFTGFDISTAVGEQLNAIGETIGLERQGATDERYRIRLRARVLINLSSGTIPQLVRLVNLLAPSGVTSHYTPYYPAAFTVETSGVLSDDEAEEIGAALIEATGGGVSVGLNFSNAEDDHTFTFADTSSPEASTTQGFSSIANTWATETAAEADGWQKICWSPELGLFCAVSIFSTGRVMTSPDGVTWTAQTAAEINNWRGICWSPDLGLFCAVANSGTHRVMTSPDGITWTAQTAAEANSWFSVCWSPELGIFCAVAGSGGVGTHRAMTSPDGITWTAHTAAAQNSWNSVCWSPELGLFCAVSLTDSFGEHVMTSPDGVTWTQRVAAEDNFWESVCWSPELGLFCAVSFDGTHRVMTSPNGTLWTAHTAAEANQWLNICWSPDLGLFCAVSNSGTNRVMTSPDGSTWTAQAAAEANQWEGVCWSPDIG